MLIELILILKDNTLKSHYLSVEQKYGHTALNLNGTERCIFRLTERGGGDGRSLEGLICLNSKGSGVKHDIN